MRIRPTCLIRVLFPYPTLPTPPNSPDLPSSPTPIYAIRPIRKLFSPILPETFRHFVCYAQYHLQEPTITARTCFAYELMIYFSLLSVVRYPLFVLLLLLTAGDLCAQSLSLFNVDAHDFPRMQGELVALDANGEIITGLSGRDLVITEDGEPVPGAITLSCPAPTGPVPMSVVLVVDRSGSMTAPLPNGEIPLDLIRIGSTAFLETLLFTPPTSVAITGFNERSFLVSDFRTSAPPLIQALQTLIPTGGTQYDPAFLDPITGAVTLLKSRPASTRKVVIFITDGEPNTPPSTQAIIDAARQEGVAVYTITMGTPMTQTLQDIALQTGGKAYGDVSASSDLAAVLRGIALISRGATPCTVQWESRPACMLDNPMRFVAVAVPSAGIGGGAFYRVPDAQRIAVETSAKSLWFGPASFPNRPQRSLQITARRGGITITGVEISDAAHFSIVDWGGSPPPFSLNEGERRTITVQFAPADTTGYAAQLSFIGDPCASGIVLLAGGERLPQAQRTPLVLQSPIGGEILDACDSVAIRWGGVPPEQPVRIQYSDNGGAWKTIVDSARGYEYLWFPPRPSNAYRVRISTDAADPNMIFTIAGGGDSLSDDIFGTEAAIIAPWGLDVYNDTLYIAEAGGRNRVRTLDLYSHIISTAAGTGSPGNGGDGGEAVRARFNNPVDVLNTARAIYIADRDNFKIRVVDRATGIVTTFAGTGAIGFTPDGARVDTAQIGAPTSLAIDDTYLYFSEISSVTEPGNHRVRRIHLGTKVISTVAGGGTFYDSDGGPASKARLLTPYGIALRDRYLYFAERDAARVRRVDLTSGTITTVAGTGQPGASGDGGPATSANLNSPTDLLFVKDVLYITESTNGHRIRSVNIKTGTISTFAGTGLLGFAGDSGSARAATLNEPTSLVHWEDFIFFSDKGNERVRAITLRLADGLDSSRTAFSVNAPELRIGSGITNREVNAGSVSINALSDSVVVGLICNNGTAPLILDSVAISGENGGDFRIVSGMSRTPIPAGECRTIAIEFAPTATGQRKGTAIFYGSCTLPDTLSLFGTGLPECGLAPIELVDFGDRLLNQLPPDSLVTAAFCNRGSTTISGNVQLLTPAGTFTIVSGGGPFTLQPNECLNVLLRFRPSTSGLTMGIIDYGIPGECGQARTILSGRAMRPQELTAQGLVVTTATCPEERVDTAVVLRNVGEAPLQVTNLSLTLNNEGFSILSPLPTVGSPLTIPGGGEEKITIGFGPMSAGAKSALLTVESNNPAGDLAIPLSGRRDSLALTATASQIVAARDPGAVYPRDTVITLHNTGERAMTVTGATTTGGDALFFAVPSDQFPITIPPGATEEVAVQILQPTEDKLYRTDVVIAFEPSCTLPEIRLALIHAGSGPTLTAEGIAFPSLLCDDPQRIDSTVTVHNFGGSDLRIDAITLLNDPEGNFSTTGGTPIIIPPGGSAEISVSFVPKSSGTKNATLRLTTNTENGVEEIALSGERERVSFTLSESLLAFDPAPNGTHTGTVELRNTGTVPITWGLSSTGPLYTIVSILPATAGPGESSILTVRYDGPPEGGPEDSLVVGEAICGATEQLRLRTENESGTVEVWLPHDSVLFNTRLHVPLRYRISDGTEPNDQDTFVTTIRFKGTTFFFEGLTAGEVVEKEWDQGTNELSITIRGTFAGRKNDTLTSLIGTALLAQETTTPLAFEGFAWSRPSIATLTTDGSLTVLGTCLDSGLHLTAGPPRVERVRPNPASNRAVVEFSLSEWVWMRGDLVDAAGKVTTALQESYVPAGHHELVIDTSQLPAGLYLLRLETPHGNAETPILVVR